MDKVERELLRSALLGDVNADVSRDVDDGKELRNALLIVEDLLV